VGADTDENNIAAMRYINGPNVSRNIDASACRIFAAQIVIIQLRMARIFEKQIFAFYELSPDFLPLFFKIL